MVRKRSSGLSRRTLLVGGGGLALVLAWGIWPRRYAPNLRAAPGETVFNAFLKIGSDGRIVVAVPQAELGQGVYTSLPQILADELGADWRTVAVEPAPLSPVYANHLLVEEIADDRIPSAVKTLGRWALREYATRSALMITGGSTSIRAFEASMRDAGSAARALLAQAAAARWDVDWESLDAHSGFIWNGKERFSFGELAVEASKLDVPRELPIRSGMENRLVGEPVPRLDLPAKVDGSAQFAGDIRLPGMVFGSVRQGPIGDSRLVALHRKAAQRVPGLVAIVERPGWVGTVATTWWAANRAVERLAPRFATPLPRVSSQAIDQALHYALERGSVGHSAGQEDVDAAGGEAVNVVYAAGPVPNAPLEPLTATVRFTGDRLEVWAPTQAPGFARSVAARAAGLRASEVTIYPTFVGGGYGRKLETAAIEQAVIMAKEVDRPVQLTWSRIEETLHDSFRPPARARLTARVAGNGALLGWRARIAAPATVAEVTERLGGNPWPHPDKGEAAAVDGAWPPYTIQAVSVEHVPAPVPIPTGLWRSAAHSYTAFFTECFIDELARRANIEPMSYRMQMLGGNVRLARALSTAAALGGWDGGASGSALGIAGHSAFGSHAALMVEVSIDKSQQIRVSRAVCAVDCGRIVNPDIVRQQIEGGILFGIAGATGTPIRFENGLPTAVGFKDLGLPLLAQSPEVTVELIASDEPSGGVTELGVPPVAPAIANAVFALTGQRLRSLPLLLGSKG